MNTNVNFEIAKLLKEKGFHQHHEFSEGYTKNGDLFHQGYGDLNKTQDYFQAPTIAEVVMWLYEKHGIWIYARPFWSGYFHEYIVDNSGEMIEAINNINFNSPTEAYSEAIEYTLKNLI